MSRPPILSFNRIFLAALALSVLIIGFLFFYRSQHLQPNPTSSSGNSLILSVGKPLKPFELWSANKEIFTQRELMKHWSLVFFGFTHCTMICPTTMGMLADTYQVLSLKYPTLQIIFVSLDPERDTPDVLKTYAGRFNPKFISVTGEASALRKLQAQLGIFSAREHGSTPSDYSIQHTTSILLINPKGEYVGLFRYGLTPNEFIKEFEAGIKNLQW